jgi:hypothetical protein
MGWTVKFTNSARRGVAKLPAKVRDAVEFLTSDMETAGPAQMATLWKDYWPFALPPLSYFARTPDLRDGVARDEG